MLNKEIARIFIFTVTFLAGLTIDAGAQTWTQKDNLGGSVRSGATGFSIGNKGYITTGYTGSVYCNDLWEFDPVANTDRKSVV